MESNKGILFRDRALRPGEKSHYVCNECGCELHPDMVYSHKCSPLNKYLRSGFNGK